MYNKPNPSFLRLIKKIQKLIPIVMLGWILITYFVTGLISVFFIPLPLWITIPISFVIQGSRFLVVFMNFLNSPSIYRSKIPPKIALFATLISLTELLFTIWGRNSTFSENASIYLFFSTVILFGYFLEVNFIKNGEEVLCNNQPLPNSGDSIVVFQNGQAKQTVIVWPVDRIFPIGCQKWNSVLTDAGIKISRKGANNAPFFCSVK